MLLSRAYIIFFLEDTILSCGRLLDDVQLLSQVMALVLHSIPVCLGKHVNVFRSIYQCKSR